MIKKFEIQRLLNDNNRSVCVLSVKGYMDGEEQSILSVKVIYPWHISKDTVNKIIRTVLAVDLEV